MVNDKLDARCGGLKLSRRCYTKRPESLSHVCQFGFTVSYDTVGFYVVDDRCHTYHSNHMQVPKFLRYALFGASHLSAVDHTFAYQMKESNPSSAVI